MSAKMTVIYLKHTGHIVAALVEPSSGAPSIDALVGSALPLSGVRAKGSADRPGTFSLPPSVLETKSLALDTRVIARPQWFAVDGDSVAELPEGKLEVAKLDADAVTVAVTVTVKDGSNNDKVVSLKVLSMVRGESGQRIQAGELKETATLDLPLTTEPDGSAAGLAKNGTFFFATAVGGMRIIYQPGTAP